MLHRLIAAAGRHDLEVESCTLDDDRSSEHVIWQVWIKNPRRGSWSTRLLVTCSRGTPTVTVCDDVKTENSSWRRAFTWLSIIAI